MNPRVLYRAAAYGDARTIADSTISALSPAAWYRNATGVTSAGGFASQWDDYSGNARHLVQATGTNQPAYANGIFTFDGVDNYMKTAAFTLNIPVSAFIVSSQLTFTNLNRLFDGGADQSMSIYQDTGAGNRYIARTGNTTSSDLAGTGTSAGYRIFSGVYTGIGDVTLGVNDTTYPVISGTTIANPGGITLSAAPSGPSFFGNQAVKEFIVFSSALDAADRAAVIAALNNVFSVF